MSTRKVLPLSATKSYSRAATSASSTPKLAKNFINNSRMFGTSATKSSNLSQLNSTVCSIKNKFPSYIPQDADFEADIIYSEYLQALLMKSITRKILSEDKIAWDTDLCDKNEVLFSKENELLELECKHQINEIQITRDNLCIHLKSFLDKWLCDLECNSLPDKICYMVKILDESCNKLELENITPLLTSEEYTKLRQSINACAERIKSLQYDQADSTALNHLAIEITKYISLCNVVHKDTATLQSSTKNYAHLLYKTLSDAFSEDNRDKPLYTF